MSTEAGIPPINEPSITASGRWVWWSSDESIAHGQTSMLALAEIPVAMAVFWGIASLSPWPWLTLTGLMAAPLLLLRSPESIADGVAALRTYWNEKQKQSRLEKSVIALAVALGTGIVCYWLAQAILPGHAGWALFWRGVVLGMVAVAVASTVFFAGRGEGVGAVTFAGATAGAIVAVIAVVASVGVVMVTVASVAVVAGVGVGVGMVEVATDAAIAILFPSAMLGIFVRTTIIRLNATVTHFHDGLLAFSKNWLETVCVIDLKHLPSLLPGAADVDKAFSMKGLLETSIKYDGILRGSIVIATLGPLIYLPALLYRWNIKASAMIWGPLAWGLRPAAWLDDEDMRSRTSTWTTWGFLSFAGPTIVAFFGWLLLPFTEPEWIAEAPSWLRTLAVYWPPPVFTLRHLMLALLATSLVLLWLSAYQIRAAHAKALEGAGDFHKGYDDALKARLRVMANTVRVRLQWTTAIAALTIWAVTFQWALQRWPNDTQYAVWDWLRPWL